MEVWFFSLVLVFGLSFASSAEDGCSRSAISLSNNESIEVEVGDCVTFQCTPNENDLVHWELNGTKIINDTHYNINTTSGTLTIQEVRSNDTGNYTCDLESTFLNVKIPNITITGQYTNLTVGSSVNVSCTTMPPIPNSVIRWHSSSFNTTNNKLIIDPVVLSNNNDTFTCTVSSSLLAKNLTESITISVIDTLTVHLLPSYVIGDKVSIVCTVRLISADVSSLVVNWFKDSTMRITDSITDIGLPPTHNSILTLTVGSPTDAGVYTCNASINAGSNIELTDSKPLCLRDLVPFNQGNDNFTNLSLGYNAIVQCVDLPSLNGITIKSIKWTNSNGDLISNNNTLILPNVVPSLNNSKYTCTAEVDTNPSTCSPDKRTITIDTKRTYVSSIIMSSQSSFLINSPFKIECIITLNTLIGPGIQPNVTWYHDETDITHYSSLMRNNDTAHVFTSLLTIDSIQEFDARVYNCNAGIDSNVTTNNIKVPDIIVTGRYTDLTVGSRVSINCTTMPSIPNSNIEWHSSSFNIDSNELIIDSVMLSHNNKMFTCTVSSSLLAMNLTKSITISVLDTSVSYVTVQSLSSYVIGDDVSIVCTISLTNAIGPDVSLLVVNWFKDDDMITTNTTNNNDLLSTFYSTLTVTQVSPTDAGVYACNASIDGSDIELSDSMNLCLKVNETLSSVTEELSLGQNYSIDCITGPVPTGVSVSWLLTNGSIYSNNNTLMIPSILPSHNTTQYTCTIMIETNPSDCSTQSQGITLIVKATYINSVTVSPTSIVRFINTLVVMTCTINLNTGIGPDTSFVKHYWYRRSADINNRSTQLMINGDSKSLVTTLTITNVQPSDAGDYQCGTSIDGNDTVRSSTTDLCIEVHVMVSAFDDNQRLGDIKEYDCTLGYRYSGVIVQWKEYKSDQVLNNPLLLTIDQSMNNSYYTCNATINNNPASCELQQAHVTIKVKETFIKTVVNNVDSLILSNTSQHLECRITTNTDINTTNTDINSIVKVFWYRDNGNESRLVSGSEGVVSILPIVSAVTNTSFNSTLRFSPITSSTPTLTLGNYTCVAWIGEQSVRNTTSNNVQVLMKINNSKHDVAMIINHISGLDFFATCTVTTCQQSPLINTEVTVVIKSNKNIMYSKVFNNDAANGCSFQLRINFTEVQLSKSGNYICFYFLNFVELSNEKNDTAKFIIKIPNTAKPLINNLESYYEVGVDITLSCSVTYLNVSYIDVGTSITLQWSNLSNHILASSSTLLTNHPATINYIISNVNLSNAGQYNCYSFIDTTNDDDYILTSDTNTSLVNVSVIIPNEIDSMISIDPVNSMNSYYEVGSMVTLTCSIVYCRSSYIDINTEIYMEWIRGESILKNTTNSLANQSFCFKIHELKLSDAGKYNCSYYISPTESNPNIRQSERKFDSVSIITMIPIKNTSLILHPLQSYYEVGSNITLSCYIINTNSFLDDTNTAVNIKWSSQKQILKESNEHRYNENFIHILTNVSLSDAGIYDCTYNLISKTNNPYIEPSDDTSKVTNVIIKIPNGDSPRIFGKLNYFVGENINLFCIITYQDYPLIPLNVKIQWFNSSNHTLHSSTEIYIINNVSLSDAGQYTCQYNINSNNPFVLPSDNMTASVNVSIKIPNNKVPVINLIPHQSVYIAGSDITLSCSVSYPYSSYIDVPTSLTLQWFNSSNDTLNSSTIINDNNNGHTLTYTISNASLSDAGQYTCSFFINSIVPHIVTSDTTKNFIAINIMIPNDITPHIRVHPPKSYYNVNDNITLSCIINYPNDPLIDVNTTVNIQWLNDSLNSYTGLNDHTEDAEHSFNYTINNLNLTNAGKYTCSFSISPSANANVIRSNVSYSVVNISIKIPDGENPSVTQLESYYRVGDNITLTCSATYSSYIATNMNMKWLNSSNHTLHSYTGINNNSKHTISYTINNVSLSDAREYTCQYNINSNNSFVLPSDNMTASINLSIKIPNEETPVIPHQSVYDAGNDITLSCSVTYPYSSYIDIPTSLTLQWFSSSNGTLNSSTIINDNNGHTLTYTISNASLSDAGQYTCSFFIDSSVIPHIVTSNITSKFITVNIKIPNVITPHIRVHPPKSYYNVNDSITLSCIINYPTNHLIDVNTTVNIQWLNYSLGSYTKLNDHTNAAEHTFNYTINNLNLTDAGQYTCSFFFNVTENNDIIKHSDMTSEFINITIILPKGTISSITISQDDPLFGVGSNAILSCSVYYANSSFIDVDTTVHIEWKHNGVLLDSHSTGNTFSNVSFEYHLSDVNNEEYTCESYLSATDANPFIKNSNITSNTTIVTEALAVPVVVGFIFFGIILIVIIGVVALIICWLKIRGLKPSGVKVKSKELYTFSRELTKEDTDISETYRLTLNEESLYQNVKATASTHKRPVNSFPSFVKTSKKEIEDEYEDIETLAPSKSDSIAKSHALKNRFQNISPFDDNIVPLVEIKGQEGSNYINASYVSGYCRHRAYIATQGPIPSTVVDFWRMVWEYKLPTIVMLTQLVEKGINKCACYWPEDLNSEQDIGEGMKLTLKSEEVNHGYSKRKLCIKIESDDGEESSLNVTQYHFTEWPDHGVPVDKIVMISFIDNIRSSHPPKGPPLVVHCSAGVGRTGTFIVMDTMLQKMKEEDTLNIYEFVLQIRHQRMKLVQTQAQYMYIHESLAEYIQCGDTSFLVTDAYHKIKDLNKSTDDGKTGFQKEFELLKELTDYSGTLSCSDAEENQDKNRFTYNLPYNNTRVCLMTTDEEDENNYINASRITGYKRNSLFIATQLPMKNTVNDFWKMVWQERCGTIVLLCPFPQTTEVFSFWPAQVKTCCEYDSAVVTLKSMIEDIGFNAYSLEIKTGDETGSSRQSCLFHYQEWPADASRPKPGSSLVNLFESVVKNQSKTGNKPIVVICNDGVGCSGTFLTAYSQIERAKTEGVSDVFQFIRKARSQRPGLVDCLDQYIYCHEIISDFAEDMSQYDNFKRYI